MTACSSGRKGGKIHFVGSNGHRLALFEADGSFSADLVVPHKGAKVLLKLLDELDNVDVVKGENFAFFVTDEWSLALRLLEGKYPDYLSVMPSEFVAEASFNRAELEQAVKRLNVLDSGKRAPVKMNFEENTAVLETLTDEGEGETEVDVDFKG